MCAAMAETSRCRFSQAAALSVRDMQTDNQRILVPSSRKGRAIKMRAPIAVPLGGDVMRSLGRQIARGSLLPNRRVLLRRSSCRQIITLGSAPPSAFAWHTADQTRRHKQGRDWRVTALGVAVRDLTDHS